MNDAKVQSNLFSVESNSTNQAITDLETSFACTDGDQMCFYKYLERPLAGIYILSLRSGVTINH